MVFHCKMYPYSVAVAVPITDWLYDPPVITNWTLLIPTPAEAVALASRMTLVPCTPAPFDGTSTDVVGGVLFTVSVNAWVEVLALASVAVMVIG